MIGLITVSINWLTEWLTRMFIQWFRPDLWLGPIFPSCTFKSFILLMKDTVNPEDALWCSQKMQERQAKGGKWQRRREWVFEKVGWRGEGRQGRLSVVVAAAAAVVLYWLQFRAWGWDGSQALDLPTQNPPILPLFFWGESLFLIGTWALGLISKTWT